MEPKETSLNKAQTDKLLSAREFYEDVSMDPNFLTLYKLSSVRVKCPYCKTVNLSSRHNCRSCGRELDEGYVFVGILDGQSIWVQL